MDAVLVGGYVTASLLAALGFLRFFRHTHDRFFLLFALSFLIEGVNRLILQFVVGPNEDAPLCYLVRLVAYGLILIAIMDKNRPASPADRPDSRGGGEASPRRP